MAMQNPYSNYANNAINTATQEELTLMLYEGAIKFVNKAMIALEAKDYEKTHENIVRVQDIVREFQLTLDHQYAISKELNALYDYMLRRLIDANVAKSMDILSEMRDMLREFRDMWKEAMVTAKKR